MEANAVQEKVPRIANLQDFIQASLLGIQVFGKNLWWRGHSVHDWRLLPWVHRDSAIKKREQELTFGFTQGAPSRYAKCPGMDNLPGWLFLMQHYGLPTCLLDWSESALTGLFFAVWDDKFSKTDGCVWGFNPYRFNENQIKEARVLGAFNKKCQTLFREAFDKKEEFDKRIMAVIPTEIDQRVQAQLSRFTIHGEDIPLETFPSQGELLLQLVIPSEAKNLFVVSCILWGLGKRIYFQIFITWPLSFAI